MRVYLFDPKEIRRQKQSERKYHAFSIQWAHGGEVAAVPGGADAIRSFHPSLFIQDEAAHIPEGEESLNAVIPSQARIISISTAAPGWFGDRCDMGPTAEEKAERDAIVSRIVERAEYPFPVDRRDFDPQGA